MKIQENKFKYIGYHPCWLLPAIIVDINKYDDYPFIHHPLKHFFTLEVVWFVWEYNLWIDF